MLLRDRLRPKGQGDHFDHSPARRPSLAVIDDSPVHRSARGIEAGRCDFYRFAMLFQNRVDALTLCMPVFDRNLARPRASSVIHLDEKVNLAATYPYRRVTEYLRKLPMAVAHNAPALRREIERRTSYG